MMKEIDIKKRLAENWFSYLQLEICNQFQWCDKDKNPGDDKYIYSKTN